MQVKAVGRRWHQKGMLVIVVGPDGSGKSTLARRLADELVGQFRGTTRMHWRPGLLPRAGAFLGRSGGDPTTPHAQRPHGRAVSALVLGYYWLDFFLGGWLKLWPLRQRGYLVVMERGWFDFAVDGRRYRLQVSPRLVLALASLLPTPDVVLVLEAPPETLLARKRELPAEELSRQSHLWRRMVFPRKTRTTYVAATDSMEEIVRESRRQVLDRLGGSDGRETQPSWVALPTSRSPRWFIPRSPSLATKKSFLVYHPVTWRSRVGWQTGQLLSAAGVFRRLRPFKTLPREVWEAVVPFLPPGGAVSVARANHPGRFLALVVGERGELRAFVKVARDSFGVEALERECEAVRRLGPLLPAPLYAPAVRTYEPGVLVLEPVEWSARLDPWRLPEEVAHALGQFFRRTVTDPAQALGSAHGDCAAWNLLRTDSQWALLDWENARDSMPPFYDLFHFIVQANVELRRPSKRAIIGGLKSKGWVGAAIEAYAEGAAIDRGEAGRCFSDYLKLSSAQVGVPVPPRGVRIRRKLAKMLKG